MADYVVSGNMVVSTTPTMGLVQKTSFGTLTPGQVVYNNTSIGAVALAVATSGTTASVYGLTMASTVSGQTNVIMTAGNWQTGTTVAPGGLLLLSKNAGNLAPASDLSSGSIAVVVGMSLSGGIATLVNSTANPPSVAN